MPPPHTPMHLLSFKNFKLFDNLDCGLLNHTIYLHINNDHCIETKSLDLFYNYHPKDNTLMLLFGGGG